MPARTAGTGALLQQLPQDALGARLGIHDYSALISECHAKARLHAWTDATLTAGVFGVPTLAVNHALFWGVDALQMAVRPRSTIPDCSPAAR